MIDTIVLMLKQNMFTIFEHQKFSPSTEGLYNASNYFRLGGRSNMTCVQNPTSSELKNGIYKPRLTVTKRINKDHNFEITLKIEFSIPKLLYGNNFDELSDTDFDHSVQLLKQKLREMGVGVFEALLINSPVSAIHFSKNIPLTDYTTPYTYLEKLSKVNLNQRLDLNQTDFRNEGHSLKYRANSFEIAFYDKLKDLDRAKTSEKRAEERGNAIQLNLFEKIELEKPFEVLRMEVRLNKRQKLRQVLRVVGIDAEPTYQALFKRETARKVLLYYLNEIEISYPSILSYQNNDPKELFTDLTVNNPKIALKKVLQMVGLKMIIDKIGIREFREISKRYGQTNWYHLYKEIKSLTFPKTTDVFKTLRDAITDFTPLKLVDFQTKMLNNVNESQNYGREVLHSTGNSKDTQSSLYDGLPLDTSGKTEGVPN